MGRREGGRGLIPDPSRPEDSNTKKADGLLQRRTDRTRGSRIPELDGLRGIAIGLVLLYHFFDFHPGPNHHPIGIARNVFVYFERLNDLGWTGVDLFFILSGFLIGGILLDNCASPRYFKAFYLRRFFRIIPIYYVLIVSYFAVIAVSGNFLTAQFGDRSITRHYQIFSLFLFLQNYWFFRYPPIAVVWFGPTWSLAVEEQFYLVAPLIMRLLSKRVLYVLLGATVCLAPLLRIWVHYNLHAQGSLQLILSYTMAPCRADALAIGIFAALLWRNTTFRQWLVHYSVFLYLFGGVLLAGVLILGKWFPDADSLPMQAVGYTWMDMFYCLILLLVLEKTASPLASFTRMAWLRQLGRVSYCLYLIHPGVGFICERVLAAKLEQANPWHGIARNTVAMFLSYAIARLSWTYLEYPLLQKGHALKY